MVITKQAMRAIMSAIGIRRAGFSGAPAPGLSPDWPEVASPVAPSCGTAWMMRVKSLGPVSTGSAPGSGSASGITGWEKICVAPLSELEEDSGGGAVNNRVYSPGSGSGGLAGVTDGDGLNASSAPEPVPSGDWKYRVNSPGPPAEGPRAGRAGRVNERAAMNEAGRSVARGGGLVCPGSLPKTWIHHERSARDVRTRIRSGQA